MLHRTSTSALSLALATLAASAATAQAADLTDSCCADLEERVAELEATVARKGNRKLSLEIYGQVNEAVLIWDDGGERNAYLVTNDNARGRFGFRGSAKLGGEWEAGYRLEVGVRTISSKRFTQDDSIASADSGFDLRDSYWFVKNKSLGSVFVGRSTTATNAITESNLSQTAQFSKYSDVEDSGLGLRLRSAATGGLSALTWRRLLGDGGDQPGEGERAVENVRYETPAWSGFVASASWGMDDVWDVALRYTGDGLGFKYVAGIGYGEVLDDAQTQTVCVGSTLGTSSDARCHNFGGSLSVLHEATGLFVNVGAGLKTDDRLRHSALFTGTGADNDQTFWAIQAGVEKKFNSFGKTTIYGEYYDYDGGANQRRTIDGTDGGVADALNPFATGDSAIWATGLEMWGAGIAQSFDKAALLLYLSYRHYEADLTLRQIVGGSAAGLTAGAGLEDLDVVLAGGLIKF
jgi:predicted porin